jgi:hypothetical protein
MFKSIAAYGLAFGSAATAMHLVYWYNRLYLKMSVGAVLPLIGNIVFTGLAVWLFIRGLNRQSETAPNLGKSLFGALLTSLLVALCTVAGLQHVSRNMPERVQEYSKIAYENQSKRIKAEYPESEQPKKLAELQQVIHKQMDPMTLTTSQIQMCLSTGVVVALLIFVGTNKKQ